MSNRSQRTEAQTIDKHRFVERYEAAILGAPFRVILCNAVKQYTDASTGKIRTQIPNLSGLKKQVALARCLHSRKLNGLELKFVRKSIDYKAIDLAALLDITPEHLSRCEGGDRALSGAAEKLLRVIVLKRTHMLADLIGDLVEEMKERDLILKDVEEVQGALRKYKDCVADVESKVLRMDIEAAFDSNDPLEFSFSIKEMKREISDHPTDDDAKWQMAKAA